MDIGLVSACLSLAFATICCSTHRLAGYRPSVLVSAPSQAKYKAFRSFEVEGVVICLTFLCWRQPLSTSKQERRLTSYTAVDCIERPLSDPSRDSRIKAKWDPARGDLLGARPRIWTDYNTVPGCNFLGPPSFPYKTLLGGCLVHMISFVKKISHCLET